MERGAKKLKYEKFNEAERRLLIVAVKARPNIWDKSHKLHTSRNAMKVSWSEIGKEMGKSDEACKHNWRSILDSKRYYTQKRKVLKRVGSGYDSEYLSDESHDSFEFSEDLDFLTEESELRTTSCPQSLYNTEFQPIPDISSNDFEVLHSPSSETKIVSVAPSPDTKKTSYSNRDTTVSQQNICLSEMKESASKIVEVMSTLVDVAKNQKNLNDDNANTPFLNYVDSLLFKLPQDVSEDIQLRIVALLHEEIAVQKIRNKKK